LPGSRQELIAISADKIIETRDEEGYLIDPDDWSPELALLAENCRWDGSCQRLPTRKQRLKSDDPAATIAP
jgi:hypothetical protein